MTDLCLWNCPPVVPQKSAAETELARVQQELTQIEIEERAAILAAKQKTKEKQRLVGEQSQWRTSIQNQFTPAVKDANSDNKTIGWSTGAAGLTSAVVGQAFLRGGAALGFTLAGVGLMAAGAVILYLDSGKKLTGAEAVKILSHLPTQPTPYQDKMAQQMLTDLKAGIFKADGETVKFSGVDNDAVMAIDAKLAEINNRIFVGEE